jgi:hypothetical protein
MIKTVDFTSSLVFSDFGEKKICGARNFAYIFVVSFSKNRTFEI